MLSVINFVKSGKVKIIAITSAKRMPSEPDWPTIAESGMPGFEASNWTALAAPVGTPPEILAKINAAANEALKSEDLRKRLVGVGSVAMGSTQQEAVAKIKEESERYGKLIKAMNIKLDL